MGLFDIIKNLKTESKVDLYVNFSKWLDKHLLKDLPQGIVAFNLNLYEGTNQIYDVELVGCGSFDEEDGDWACDEIFTTREDSFFIPKTKDIANWEQGLSFISALTEKYLHEGNCADKLKDCTAVCVGFVDGDLEILYRAK